MSKWKERLLDSSTVIVAICTVALVVSITYRHFFSGPEPSQTVRQAPIFLEEWEQVSSTGHRMGPDDAEVTVVVFSDFQCPACGTFAVKTYPQFRDKHPGQVALVFRHWPLRSHRLAYPAARAAECAAAQDRFEEFHDLLFSDQQSVGIKPFDVFAREAGVPDLDTFSSCYLRQDPVPAIERDMEMAQQIGGTGTPTVVVNGWSLLGGVGPQLLDSISRQFLRPTPDQTLGKGMRSGHPQTDTQTSSQSWNSVDGWSGSTDLSDRPPNDTPGPRMGAFK
jgi:protein-disulfide isomerase